MSETFFIFKLCPECLKLIQDLCKFDVGIHKFFVVEEAEYMVDHTIKLTLYPGKIPGLNINFAPNELTHNKNEFKDWAVRRIFYATKKPQTV